MLTERKLTCEADAGGQEEATIKKNTIFIAQLLGVRFSSTHEFNLNQNLYCFFKYVRACSAVADSQFELVTLIIYFSYVRSDAVGDVMQMMLIL